MNLGIYPHLIMTHITLAVVASAYLALGVPPADGTQGAATLEASDAFALTGHGPAEAAAPDTAVLNTRIEDAFPDYRLSTEAEIAGRFPLIDGSTLSMYVPEYGSGELWWIQRADLTGDGEEEVLTIVTSVDDPAEDQLVVLHPDGTGSKVGALGGWGFGHGEDESGPYVAIIFYEKGADIYRWDGDEFAVYYDPDDCC